MSSAYNCRIWRFALLPELWLGIGLAAAVLALFVPTQQAALILLAVLALSVALALFAVRLRLQQHRLVALDRPCSCEEALATLADSQQQHDNEKRELLLRLEQTSQHAELISNNVAASILLSNLAGDISYCSPFTEVLTGYSVEEISKGGMEFVRGLVVEDDRERFDRAYRVSELGEDNKVQYRLEHANGLHLWVETRLVPIADSGGEVTGVMSLSIDVTALIQNQKLVNQQNHDLRDFTYMVSHDLKAPVFTIKGMVSILQEECGASLSTEAQNALSYINEGAGRLERLISSVVEYSSLSFRDFADGEVALDQVIEQVLRDLAQQIRESGAQIRVVSPLPTVRGDSLRIYQVFSNLLGNALKFRDPQRIAQIACALRTHLTCQ